MKFLREAVVSLARLGPLGLQKAPGTWGSAAGLAFYALAMHNLNNTAHWRDFIVVEAALIAFAVVVCQLAEYFIGKKDPGEIVLDEFVAVPLVFAGFGEHLRGIGNAWAWYLVGFGFFRLFDIAKPFGIRRLGRIRGGLGIVIDDLAAAVFSAASIQLLAVAVRFLR